MQINQFLEKQTYLGITNSVLKQDTKVNEKLLDYVYVSLEKIKQKSTNDSVTCNVLISEIPNTETMNLKMSGSSYTNNKYCYDSLKYYFEENKGSYSGSSVTKESDYYKISMAKPNTLTSTTKTTSNTNLTSVEDPSKSRSELEQQMAKIVYRSVQDRYGDSTTKEAVEYKENLLEEINKIKKIMII